LLSKQLLVPSHLGARACALEPLVQAVCRDSEIVRDLLDRVAPIKHLAYRFLPKLRCELLISHPDLQNRILFSKCLRSWGKSKPSNVIVYGWSVQQQDEHLLDRTLSNSPEFLAISSFQGEVDPKQVDKTIDHAAGRVGVEKPDVVLYDAESAWKPSAPLDSIPC